MRRGLMCAALLGGVALATSAADTPTLTVHLDCSGAVPQDERMAVRYWSPELARGKADPACVRRNPELAGLPFTAARVEPGAAGVGAVAVLELDESARPLLERLTQQNRGRSLAFIADGRILLVALIFRPYSDHRIYIHTGTRAEAERLVSAVFPAKRAGIPRGTPNSTAETDARKSGARGSP
jgi:preprotein translocase subunit SecD